MRIAVLGAGSIGGLFGSHLYRMGYEVTLYNHNPTIVGAVQDEGIRIREEGRVVRIRVPISFPPRNLRKFDLVIITTKAYDTSEVARRYARKDTGNATVLTLQNGLGNYETLSRAIGKGRVIAGSTTEAALTLRPGLVIHTGHGETWLGEYEDGRSERCTLIAEMFRKAGFRTNVTRNIRRVIWNKAVINSAINPLTALTHQVNGFLLDSMALRHAVGEVINESASVARAEGIRSGGREMYSFAVSVLKKSAKNRSSMLQDIESGRRTEVEQLNGMIGHRARSHGIKTPLNDLLLNLIRGIELDSSKKI